MGTVTEVYADYLRLLYARIGKTNSTARPADRPVARQSPQQIVDRILAMGRGDPVLWSWPPVVRGRKGEYGALLDDLAKQGFARVRVDGETAGAGRAVRGWTWPATSSTPSRWWWTGSSGARTSGDA